MSISVNLTIRATTPDGQRFYPLVSANDGNIKSDWVWTDSKDVRCPKGTDSINYTDSLGKRVRTSWGRSRQKRKFRVFAKRLNSGYLLKA